MNYYIVSVKTKEMSRIFAEYVIDKGLRWGFEGELVQSLWRDRGNARYLMSEKSIWETGSYSESKKYLIRHNESFQLTEIDMCSLIKPIYKEI